MEASDTSQTPAESPESPESPQEPAQAPPAAPADAQPADQPVSDSAPESAPAVETQVAPTDAAATPPAAPKVAQAVIVDQSTRRSDNDALEGGAVKIIDGEHAGQAGAFVKPIEYDPSTGYPTKILVRIRDTTYDHEYVTVEYDAVRPAGVSGKPTGGPLG